MGTERRRLEAVEGMSFWSRLVKTCWMERRSNEEDLNGIKEKSALLSAIFTLVIGYWYRNWIPCKFV